jgi:alkylresorcinol/alkylpyrone synthase
LPYITSIGFAQMPYELKQNDALSFAKSMFSNSFDDIERLLSIFQNGQINKRRFCKPFDWYKEDHSFEEKNNTYIDLATTFSIEAVKHCINNNDYLTNSINYDELDAIFFVSKTGLATPSIDVKIINALPLSNHIVRVPIWGLGCAGGTAGVARGMDYCRAYPEANVLVVTVELCSLTFQRNDMSKSNLVGTSLFADGVACTLISGEKSSVLEKIKTKTVPKLITSQSTLKPHSEDVMGWNIKNDGLYVVFSRSIPHLVCNWFGENVEDFLNKLDMKVSDLAHFIAHPGGKKVLDAYEKALHLPEQMTKISRTVLEEYGNMSSTTVIYVLDQTIKFGMKEGSYGLMASLGPGFSSEMALIKGTRKGEW